MRHQGKRPVQLFSSPLPPVEAVPAREELGEL